MTEEKELMFLKLLAGINSQLKCIKMAVEVSNILMAKNQENVFIIKRYEDAAKEEKKALQHLIKTL